MRRIIVGLMLGGMATAVVSDALAGVGRGRAQHARIRQGVRSGQLTHDEAKGLRQDQRDLRRMRRDVRQDGAVTTDERTQMRDARNAASKEIYQEKHDGETR